MSSKYDAIVIGAGQAGPSLAVRLANAGLRTAIIERKLFGGTCVNVGCTPTKTLIASARAAHVARRGATYGIMIDGEVRFDLPRAKARMDAVVRESSEGLSQWLKGTPNLSVIEGHARFESARRINVNGNVLEANQIFLDVGARASVPTVPGLDSVSYLTNSSILELEVLPEHLVVIGGSYIGLEFAQMYRRFGSRVTVIEMGPRLIGREDEQVSAAVQKILEAEGVEFKLKAECISVRPSPEGVVARANCEGGRLDEVPGSHLLLAVGRVPNTSDLGLDKAGIETDARGLIVVDDQLRTNVPGVWALGEANGRGAFTHTSYNDYEIVAANLLDNYPRRVTDRISAYALFIDPPLARAGLSEAEARRSGRKVLVGEMQMSRVSRARERGETDGFMKVMVDADTKVIIGATLLGIEADEVIHSLIDVMYAGAPYTVIQRAVHIHPTVSELIPTLLGDLRGLEPAS